MNTKEIQMMRARGSYVPTPLNRPERDRLEIWKQTMTYYNDFPKQSSMCYRGIERIMDFMSAPRNHKTIVEIHNDDCIEVAVQLKEQRFNPLLLNMADWEIAGGCVDLGSAAQEEELFRRSNYFKHLLQDYYPLANNDAYLSKGVEFYCHGVGKGYVLMDKPVALDCVASPAVRFPGVTSDFKRFASEEHARIMREKIRQLFWIAQDNGNDSLVLSAWGCGAFGCPPWHVAQLFKEICEERCGVFKKVVFAILGPNYKAFVDAW
jgi:uncharacterized protein (TIGR02452 family)